MKRTIALALFGFTVCLGSLAASAAEVSAEPKSSLEEDAQYLATLSEKSPEQLPDAMSTVCKEESKTRLLLVVELAADRLNKQQKPKPSKQLKEAFKKFKQDGALGCKALRDEEEFLSDFLRPGPVPSGS